MVPSFIILIVVDGGVSLSSLFPMAFAVRTSLDGAAVIQFTAQKAGVLRDVTLAVGKSLPEGKMFENSMRINRTYIKDWHVGESWTRICEKRQKDLFSSASSILTFWPQKLI